MANLETILEENHLGTPIQYKRYTGLIILPWTQDWVVLEIGKITRPNDLINIVYHIGHSFERRQRNIIYLTFKHIEIHYIGFTSRIRKWNCRFLKMLRHWTGRQFADGLLMDVYYSSLDTMILSADAKTSKYMLFRKHLLQHCSMCIWNPM